MLIVVAIFVSSVVPALYSGRNSAAWAMGGVVSLAIFVPSHSPPHTVTVAAIICSIALLAVATVKSFQALQLCEPPIALLLFLLYSAVVWLRAENKNGLLNVGIQIVLILMALLTASGTHVHRRVLVYVLLGAIFAQFALAYSEEFFRIPALWPRPDGSDVLTSRVNPLAPSLPGRAMGSTSQPIPLGMLAGMALVSAIWLSCHTKRRAIPVLAAIAAAITIVFSGTRSALIGCILAGLLFLLLSARTARASRYLVGLPVLAILCIVIDLPNTLGFVNFQRTESYEHRSNVLQSADVLLDRSFATVLWGSGYDSVGALVSGGVAGRDGILVFDQEFLRTAAAGGLIGVVLLVAAVIGGFKRGDTLARTLLAIASFFLLVFDGLSWFLSANLFVICASGPLWHTPERLTLGGSALSEQQTLSTQRKKRSLTGREA